MVFDFQTFLAFTTDHTLYALCTDFAFEQEIVVESWGTNNGVVVVGAPWGSPGSDGQRGVRMVGGVTGRNFFDVTWGAHAGCCAKPLGKAFSE